MCFALYIFANTALLTDSLCYKIKQRFPVSSESHVLKQHRHPVHINLENIMFDISLDQKAKKLFSDHQIRDMQNGSSHHIDSFNRKKSEIE